MRQVQMRCPGFPNERGCTGKPGTPHRIIGRDPRGDFQMTYPRKSGWEGVMNRTAGLLLFLLTAGPVSARPVSHDFVPGQWRLLVVTSGTRSAARQETQTTCLSRQPESLPPAGYKKSMCRVTQHQMVGNTLTWTMECHSASVNLISQGRMVYQKTRLQEWVHTRMKTPIEMSYRVRVTGIRIGPCLGGHTHP